MKPLENILVLTYWSYRDALIQTYTLPYVRIMRSIIPAEKKIFLLTLEKDEHRLNEDETQQTKANLEQEGIFWIDFNYSKFGFTTSLKLAFQIFKLVFFISKKRISHLHCWCTPAGGIGYILSTLTRTTLVLDSYEPHAEAMVENGEWRRNSWAFRILWRLERLQSEKATCIISATSGMQYYMREKYHVEKSNFFIKPACVDLQLFSLANIKNKQLVKQLNLEGKIVAIYAGKLGGIYLKTEVFDFFKVASDYWGDAFHVVMLSNHKIEEIHILCEASNFPIEKLTLKFVFHHDIPNYIGLGDFAITPVKPVPTKKYCTPIKDGEYWALGLPVVITKDISDDSNIIEKYDIGAVIEALDQRSYEKCITKIDGLLKERHNTNLYGKIRNIAETYRSFRIAEEIYNEIYSYE